MYNDNKLISIILQHIFYYVSPYLPIFIISQFCCAFIFPSYTKYWWPKNETSHFSHGLWHQKPATSAAATSRISHLIFKTILGGLMLQNYYYLVALEYFDAFDIYWQHPTTTYVSCSKCTFVVHLATILLYLFFIFKKTSQKKSYLSYISMYIINKGARLFCLSAFCKLKIEYSFSLLEKRM